VLDDCPCSSQSAAVVQEESASTLDLDVQVSCEVKKQSDDSQLPVALGAEGSRSVAVSYTTDFNQDPIQGVVRPCLRR
jgi:hypothetical protein